MDCVHFDSETKMNQRNQAGQRMFCSVTPAIDEHTVVTCSDLLASCAARPPGHFKQSGQGLDSRSNLRLPQGHSCWPGALYIGPLCLQVARRFISGECRSEVLGSNCTVADGLLRLQIYEPECLGRNLSKPLVPEKQSSYEQV